MAVLTQKIRSGPSPAALGRASTSPDTGRGNFEERKFKREREFKEGEAGSIASRRSFDSADSAQDDTRNGARTRKDRVSCAVKDDRMTDGYSA
jgi:hypothetical protein